MKSSFGFDLENRVSIDLWDCCTPDLPKLRYFGGGIPVFLWDSLAGYNALQTYFPVLEKDVDYKILHYTARTANTFIPMKNKGKGKNTNTGYMLGKPDETDCLLGTMPTLRKVRGKVLSCSLTAVETLDFFYRNGYNFNRKLIQVSPLGQKPVMTAYTYLNDLDQLVDIDEKGDYMFLSEGMELSVAPRVNEDYQIV